MPNAAADLAAAIIKHTGRPHPRGQVSRRDNIRHCFLPVASQGRRGCAGKNSVPTDAAQAPPRADPDVPTHAGWKRRTTKRCLERVARGGADPERFRGCGHHFVLASLSCRAGVEPTFFVLPGTNSSPQTSPKKRDLDLTNQPSPRSIKARFLTHSYEYQQIKWKSQEFGDAFSKISGGSE